jgi:phospholipid-binding lipoprotein MlaA
MTATIMVKIIQNNIMICFTQSALFKRYSIVVLLALLSGCATTENKDPYESINRDIHSFNLKADKYLMKPVAKGYRWVTPNIVDRGITNFFGNLQGVRVTFNDLLQAKFQDAGFDMLRFAINSTVGIGGLFDVASELEVPKGNEDFSQTLGTWGVPSGPFLVIPLLGPSNLRGIGGTIGDYPFNPMSYIGYFGPTSASFGMRALEVTDIRADLLQLDDVIEEMKDYTLMRDAYIQNENYRISDGELSADAFDDEDFYDESDEVSEPIE